MLRILNILAICALMGSAVYAYSTKYQTSFRAEQIAKTKFEIKAERDAIAVLRADWAYMTRPERLQPLAEKYLPEFGPLQVTQLVTLQSLPQKTRSDWSGAKLSEIGLSAAAFMTDKINNPCALAKFDKFYQKNKRILPHGKNIQRSRTRKSTQTPHQP